ncbi:hypothetical protein GGH12_001344 [Coemansia sp. RSA 1822]|nr:hypothetical protein GGH12_001344 [Coemansia sp. RSA 1822]
MARNTDAADDLQDDFDLDDSFSESSEPDAQSIPVSNATRAHGYPAYAIPHLVKMLRVVTKRPVAKLFSRHIKIDAQKKMLEEGAVDVAIGR